MKTKYLSLVIVLSLFLVSGCIPDGPALTKSASLGVKFYSSASANGASSNGRIVTTGFKLTDFSVNLIELVIEENSGNDVESEGNDQNDKNDKNDGKEDKNDGTEAEDVFLPGPFPLDLTSGSAFIEKVEVYPGTFKKINFTFDPSSNADFVGSSIVIAGDYTMPDESVIPVLLLSDFDGQIQLPLANGGVTVANNSSVDISITLDAQNLLSSVDLSSATVKNGKIAIDKTNNADLLAQFEENLSQFIDVED